MFRWPPAKNHHLSFRIGPPTFALESLVCRMSCGVVYPCAIRRALIAVAIAPVTPACRPELADFAFVVSGEATFGDRQAQENDVAIFERDGDAVVIASERGAELLLIGGEPLNEPVARYGPFVMNTTAEIRQAMIDYQNGSFGEIG